MLFAIKYLILYNYGMETIKQIGSYFTWKSQGSDSQESMTSKFTKIAAGVGIAGLAFVSWKIVAAGALAYSAYKGGRYIHSRYFQKHEVRRDSNIGARVADLEERHPEYPVNAGHDAHNDTQEEATDVIADLKKMQANYCLQAPHNAKAIKRTFDLVISHPDILTKGKEMHWVGKMLKKHGPWVKRTGGLSLPFVQAYRKIKCCLPTKKKSEHVE